MKTISLLLVMVGVCLAKPPSLFPDFLAPFRNIFGSSRGGGPGGDRSIHPNSAHDATGAETRKPHPVDESHDVGFRPNFLVPFSNSPQDSGKFASDAQPQLQHEGRPSQPYHAELRPSQPYHAEGRPSQPYHAEGRPTPQFLPQQGRPPPNFQQLHHPMRQHNPSYQPKTQQQTAQGMRYQVISQPQSWPPQHQYQPPSPFPGYQQQPHPGGFSDYQQPPQEQPTSGDTYSSLNPTDFENGNYGSLNDKSGQTSPPFIPSTLNPDNGNHGYGQSNQQQQVFGVNLYQPRDRSHPYTDPQNDGGQNEVDENGGIVVDYGFQQPSETYSSNPMYQGAPMRGPTGTLRISRPYHSTGVAESPNYDESQRSKIYMSPNPLSPSSQQQGIAQHGKQMMMSGSSIGPPTILTTHRRRRRLRKVPMLLASPTIQPPKEQFEPMAAASSSGVNESYGEGNPMDDRVLYHVAGHQGPYSYRFGYDTGKGYNRMFRHEEKDGSGVVKGKYGFHDKHGKLQVVNYSAHPKGGFQAERANQPLH